MNKCRYCHKLIYPWQSDFSKPRREPTTHLNHAILINPDYDRHMHEGCYFRKYNNIQIHKPQKAKKEADPITPLNMKPPNPITPNLISPITPTTGPNNLHGPYNP